jgi:serine protease Do
MGIGEVGELLRKSTVHIRSGSGRRQSTGSGIIWSSTGAILSNAHVITQRSDIQVDLWDGRSFPAQLESRDDARDLARLSINTFLLDAIAQRDSPVRPGELAVAVGNPLGFIGALTQGSVHTVGPFPGLGRRRTWVQSAIRLAPGNSGGPLADACGRLIGVNTMITSTGVALAIPAKEALMFMRHGAGPRLGVSVRPTAIGKRDRIGLLLLDVEAGSPAERASLLIGDLLIAANGMPFRSSGDLSDAILESLGRPLSIKFFRADRSREREVVVQMLEKPREAAA